MLSLRLDRMRLATSLGDIHGALALFVELVYNKGNSNPRFDREPYERFSGALDVHHRTGFIVYGSMLADMITKFRLTLAFPDR